MNVLGATLLALVFALAIGACSSKPAPLPAGLPPEYEAPRQYDPGKAIDALPTATTSAFPIQGDAPDHSAAPPSEPKDAGGSEESIEAGPGAFSP